MYKAQADTFKVRARSVDNFWLQGTKIIQQTHQHSLVLFALKDWSDDMDDQCYQ